MEIKMDLTLDDIDIISAALNNDALVYLDCAKEEIEDKEYFDENMDSYRKRMILKKKFNNLYLENISRL